MKIEWHSRQESIENCVGGGGHAYHDRGGLDGPDDTLHKKRQIVLFTDSHVETLPFMTNADFVKDYWPGEIGNLD